MTTMATYSGDDIEVVRLGDWKPVRARKPRSCSTCLSTIKKGEVYCRQAWKVDGEIQVTTTHDPYGACSLDGVR